MSLSDHESDCAPTCSLCGQPMPPGEEMFKFHGYSGPCPSPASARLREESDAARSAFEDANSELARERRENDRLTAENADLRVRLSGALFLAQKATAQAAERTQMIAALSAPVEPAGAHVETLHQMVGMAGEFRQTLLTVRECIDALTPGHRTGYDWNADPLYMTRYVGDALKAIDAGLTSLNGQAAVPTYRNVYIVTHYPDGGLRGVHASQAGAEAEIADLCREYPEYSRRDFSITCGRIRPFVEPAGASEPPSEAQLLADLRAEYVDDYSRVACDDCPDCGPLAMCSFHSVLSQLFKGTMTNSEHARRSPPAPVSPVALQGAIAFARAADALRHQHEIEKLEQKVRCEVAVSNRLRVAWNEDVDEARVERDSARAALSTAEATIASLEADNAELEADVARLESRLEQAHVEPGETHE